MSNEREDFTVTQQRAFKAHTKAKVSGGVTKDFTWRTLPALGRKSWYWIPKRFTVHGFGWNPTGGPATRIVQVQTYWLCMGWSTITEEKAEYGKP
jgi:hypothetical protein